MKFEEISVAARVLVVSLIPVIWGAWVWLFSTFETAESAEQKWREHNQAIACRTVYELKAEIRGKEERLVHDKTLPETRAWLREQIKQLREDIQRIDPDGRC